MNFEQEIRQLQHDTAVVMAEVERLHAEHVVYMQKSMRLHEQRMAHVDMRLTNIAYMLGFMGGFSGPQ